MSRRLPRSARVARRRAPRVNPWVQLALLVVGLAVLLSFWQQIADGTAGCYSHMAAEGDPGSPPPSVGAAGAGSPEGDSRAVSVEVRLPERASGEPDARSGDDDAGAAALAADAGAGPADDAGSTGGVEGASAAGDARETPVERASERGLSPASGEK